MKKITLLFALLLATTFGSIAQDYQEIVYLTDGSMIKGFIIEQVPNDYLKIETASGKIYTIDMYEVERITKERPRTRTQSQARTQTRTQPQNVNRRQYSNQYNYTGTRNTRRDSQRYYDDEYDDYNNYNNKQYSSFPNRGYKGFIDLGFSYGTKSNVGDYEMSGENRLEFSTSHGYFFSPYFFLGLGVGFHFYTGYNYEGEYYSYDEVAVEIPIFAHIRSHFIDKKVSPFVDVKLGYSVYDVTGTYFSPSLGCRFAKGSRSAFWFSLGYTVQFIDDSYYDSYYESSARSEAFSIKVGWDF
jgi:hypothetical protein